MASIESLLQEWEKVAPKATDEVAEFVPMYGYVPFCNIKRRNLTTRFAGASPILGEALQRHCEHTDKHQFIVGELLQNIAHGNLAAAYEIGGAHTSLALGKHPEKKDGAA